MEEVTFREAGSEDSASSHGVPYPEKSQMKDRMTLKSMIKSLKIKVLAVQAHTCW